MSHQEKHTIRVDFMGDKGNGPNSLVMGNDGRASTNWNYIVALTELNVKYEKREDQLHKDFIAAHSSLPVMNRVKPGLEKLNTEYMGDIVSLDSKMKKAVAMAGGDSEKSAAAFQASFDELNKRGELLAKEAQELFAEHDAIGLARDHPKLMAAVRGLGASFFGELTELNTKYGYSELNNRLMGEQAQPEKLKTV